MIKNIFFDYNGTIINFKACETEAIKLAGHDYGRIIKYDEIVRYQEINSALWEKYNAGEISRDTVLIERFETFLREINLKILAEDFNETYLSKLNNLFILEPHVTETLELLSEKYNLYVITNGVQQLVMNKLYNAKLAFFIKDVFTSERSGYHKPSCEFFLYCLNTIDAKPEECLIVGDSLTSDIIGGVNSGIFTCWYNPQNEPNTMNVTPNIEISDFADLDYSIYNL